ncbi:MAG: hypothetical protein FWC39_12635 [Bacteroidetes bacterium]|nr:hypothetical protein [Bacteroidota bacterium]
METAVITPTKSTYSLLIPNHYIGKMIEVRFYSCDELYGKNSLNNKKPSDFFGTLNSAEGEKFHNYVNNSRAEWNRDI